MNDKGVICGSSSLSYCFDNAEEEVQHEGDVRNLDSADPNMPRECTPEPESTLLEIKKSNIAFGSKWLPVTINDEDEVSSTNGAGISAKSSGSKCESANAENLNKCQASENLEKTKAGNNEKRFFARKRKQKRNLSYQIEKKLSELAGLPR